MKISAFIQALESVAPPALQESYDNAGLLTGNPDWNCSGVLCTLDCTAAVVQEAIARGCNLIVAHHPIIFGGLKKINGKNYVERTIIAAIKNDVAIYAIHTNLDNVFAGVNGRMADKLGLTKRTVLSPKTGTLEKLFTFVPLAQAEQIRQAVFNAGAGFIGRYSECSFSVEGIGTFKAGDGATPFVGEIGKQHQEKEYKVEVVYPTHLRSAVISAMKAAHPYEEVAYDLVAMQNAHPEIGSGIVGELPAALPVNDFLSTLKSAFRLEVVRHTADTGRPIHRVAVCGGAGSFLISKALAANVDAYVTSDLKYHEFFDAEDRMLLCDIGHFESEQFTTELLADILQQKFPTFAVLKSDTKSNPVYYYF